MTTAPTNHYAAPPERIISIAPEHRKRLTRDARSKPIRQTRPLVALASGQLRVEPAECRRAARESGHPPDGRAATSGRVRVCSASLRLRLAQGRPRQAGLADAGQGQEPRRPNQPIPTPFVNQWGGFLVQLASILKALGVVRTKPTARERQNDDALVVQLPEEFAEPETLS